MLYLKLFPIYNPHCAKVNQLVSEHFNTQPLLKYDKCNKTASKNVFK